MKSLNKYFLKSFVTTIVLLTAFFTTKNVSAYILPLDTIMEKNIAQSGRRIISVDQDVIFRNGISELVVKENWLIEGDKNLILTATGLGPLKDFKINFLYNNKTKTYIVGQKFSESVSHVFFERYSSLRSVSAFKTMLQDLNIKPEVRMSRADGAISFAIGEPSPVGQFNPQVWIDQDFFRLRKIRTPYESDITFSDYASFFNDQVSYPKTKKVEWAGHSVLIRVKSVTIKQGASLAIFYPSKLERPTQINLNNVGTLAWEIEEFYKRFR